MINVYDLTTDQTEPVYTFNTTPQHAVMYCQAAKLNLLSWFYIATDQQRIDRLKPIQGKKSVSCGDFAAKLD